MRGRPLTRTTEQPAAKRGAEAPLLRVLLVADTHLGIDFALRPRVERRRRGLDFFANFERSLEPALQGDIDLVVHGGDLLDRPHVSENLFQMAMAPLVRVAKAGIPVFLVPGNHERRRIPLRLWTCHPNLHVFHEPGTFVYDAGFPCPRGLRDSFAALVEATDYRSVHADVRLLCLHGAIEGAQVGVHNFTFRHGRDVVRGQDLPGGLAAVLAGHIHRHQILTFDVRGRRLPTPVIYPGSVERTAFAERDEEKGFVLAQFTPSRDGRGQLRQATFVRLPARPMVSFELEADSLHENDLRRLLGRRFSALDADSVVRIQVRGRLPPEASWVLSAPQLRLLAPATMNVTVSYPRETPSVAVH